MKHIAMGAVLAALTMAGPLRAQQSPLAPRDTASIPDNQLFHRSDLFVAGAFLAGTIAMLPVDRHLTSVFRDEDLLSSSSVKRVASAGSFFGSQGPVIIGGTMYAVGRLARIPKMAELALHGTEALAVGTLAADLVKAVAGRARPYSSLDTNAHDFGFGRGLNTNRYKSFPSGHATAAFSVASAVVAETHEWWPQSTWYVAPVMYGGATMVGLSRIYNDQHWASDVVLGAAIGTFAGLKTVRFNHTHTGNKLDRVLLGTRLVPSANGTMVAWGATF